MVAGGTRGKDDRKQNTFATGQTQSYTVANWLFRKVKKKHTRAHNPKKLLIKFRQKWNDRRDFGVACT